LLKENLQIVSERSYNFFIVSKWKGKKKTVIPKFQTISWLNSYAEENMGQIFINTLQEKDLLDLVFNEFDLSSLLNDLFKICISTIKSEDNWSLQKPYQVFPKEVNNFIANANNGLQQVSYCLGYELVGYIHLSVVYLIWKYFEPKHWQKMITPLNDLKDKKRQHRAYFFALISANETKINKAEVEKLLQNAESYLSNRILTIKRNIIEENYQNFKSQVKRKKIQNEIDARCYFRTGKEEDLYNYILHPEEMILKSYEIASNDYLQNTKTQINDQIKQAQTELTELAE